MIPFIQARWYYVGRRGTPRLIVVHCTVSKEMGTGAEAVASYFSRADRKGSTHLVADVDSVVRCVKDEDTAFGAAGANADGLHLELVGMPDQTEAQWLDPFGRGMFAAAAPELLAWERKYAVPRRWLTVAQVRDGRTKGYCMHADVERAFPSTGHWDPGPSFPKAEFHAVIGGGLLPPGPPEQEDLDVTAEVYALFRLYFGLTSEAVDADPQRRREVSFHAWQLIDGIDGMTLSRKRAEFEAYARAIGTYS